jgi:hypothetical protein
MVRNSFISLSQQIIDLQNNSLVVLASLNQAISSTENNIQVEITDENQETQIVNIPSLGYLKAEIERLNQNLRTLSSVDQRGSIIQPARNEYSKIIKVDLNREPNSLGELNNISNFLIEKNWFFDALLNPLLRVRVDLSGKVENNVRQVLSRRYILNFELDTNGEFTARGQQAADLFNENFKNRTNITITELETWILNTPGVVANSIGNYDEQEFTLDANELQYEGFFTILGRQDDKVNRKEWYLLDTLDYYEIQTRAKKTLQLNDELIINTDFATTRYRIIEINKDASETRVRFERVEGEEPLPVSIVGGMKFYSPVIINKKVDISIGFNEYNVLFVKPINTENHLLARNWSPGTAYYTNDLILISDNGLGDNGKSMTEFYINQVKDYGEMLKDLVNRYIPRHLGIKPTAPTLDINNFRVRQINKHATDTPELEKNRKLHSQANSLRSNLDELNKTLVEKRKELFGKTFKNQKDKQNLETQISKITQDVQSKTELLNSTVTEILAANQANNSIDPIFAIEGFWQIPLPIENGKTRPQEIVKFRIEYKKASKSGQESENGVFKVTNADGTITNAVFSPWIPLVSTLRDRSFDVATQSYVWEQEDLSNIDSPNINSIQIPISPNEQVEIRVKSISEVGIDNAPIESDWSNSIILTFPDELLKGRRPEELIVKNAELEAVRNRILTELNGKTLDQHLGDFTIVENKYFPHFADNIAIRDASGRVITLSEKIKQIETADRVETMQEITLEEPWENYVNGYGTARFYKHEGRVYLSGLIRVILNDDDNDDANDKYPNEAIRTSRNQINTRWSRIAILPANYRPIAKEVFNIATSESPQAGVDTSIGRIDILPNGLIMLIQGNSGWVSLNGISFRV